MRKLVLAMILMSALLVGARPARAELLHGQYQFPGKLMLGGAPLGVQVFLNSPTQATYKFAINFSGKIWENPKLTLWLGGEFNLGGVANLAQIEPGIFATITLDRKS